MRPVSIRVLFDLKQLSDGEKHLLALIEGLYNKYLDTLIKWVEKMTDEDADALFSRLSPSQRDMLIKGPPKAN